MATHFSILAWKIPWTVEFGGLQTMRSQRVRHDKQLTLSQSLRAAEGIRNEKWEDVVLLSDSYLRNLWDPVGKLVS